MIDFQVTEVSEDTKYNQVKDSIIAAIRSGKLAPLSKLPSISQIAKDAKVSLRTADLALQALIEEGYCFRRPKKGTFVEVGQRVETRPVCGVLGHVDPIGYSFRAYLYAELMELSILKNVPALTFPTPSGESGLGISGEMIRSCDNSNEYDIKGIFILDSDHYLYGVKLAEAFPGIRFFFLNYEREDFDKMPSNMAAIVDDNYGGSRQLAESVFKEYHPKSIVYLNCPLKEGDITYQERERGVLDTAKKCGVKCFPTIEVPRSSYSLDQTDFAYEAFGKFLKTKKVDFMFAPNLHLARGVRKVIEEMGLSDEIGVAGYGGFDHSAEERISAVHSPLREICQRGFSEMLNPEFRMPQVIKLMPEIIVCSKPEVSNKKHSK